MVANTKRPKEILARFGKYLVTRDTATGMPVCSCPGGRYGLICKHVKAVDPTAKAVWEENSGT